MRCFSLIDFITTQIIPPCFFKSQADEEPAIVEGDADAGQSDTFGDVPTVYDGLLEFPGAVADDAASAAESVDEDADSDDDDEVDDDDDDEEEECEWLS